MIKKILLLISILFILSLIFLPSKAIAAYCPNGFCESGEDCNNCEADCGSCPPPPLPSASPSPGAPPGGTWVPCGEHICPNLIDWVDYRCYPDCNNPQYCQDERPCPDYVPPGVECYNDADCFPNNCYCAGGVPCEMHCIANQCISDCAGDDGGNGSGPSGTINCAPTSLRVCPPDSATGTTTVSWSTQNMSTAQVWRCVDNNCNWSQEVFWRSGASGTQNFNNVRSNHTYTFRLYAYNTHGILLDSCQVNGLCPTCSVTLPDPIIVPPGESELTVPLISYEYGTINRVRYSIANSSIASINPTTVYASPYGTTVSGVAEGETSLTANVRLDPGNFVGCTDTADVEVRAMVWFQTQEGDVHVQGNISSDLPDGIDYFCLVGEGGTPGVVSHRDALGDDPWGDGEVSETGWLAQTEFSRKRFSYFYELLGEPEENLDSGDLSLIGDEIVYYAGDDTDLEVNNDLAADKKAVILVDGDVDIRSDINVPVGSFLAVIASGSVGIPDADASSVSQIEGIFLADSGFGTGELSGVGAGFVGEGVFAASSFDLDRDLESDNDLYPAVQFVYRPDLWINAPLELFAPSYTWQELAP